MSRHALPILALLLAAAPLRAQTTTAAAPAATTTTTATPGALAAAKVLLRLMEMEKVVRAGTQTMLDLQVKQQPMMAPYKATMQAWADKYLSFAELEPGMTKIYTDAFTEAELKDLVAFYRTPAGHKAATLAPQLSQRGAEVGAAVAQAHATEMQDMIQARSVEIGGSPAKP